MRLTIIVPALNEERALPATLRSILVAAPDAEVIVVDGGSTDGTVAVAREFEGLAVRVMESPRGRGTQMNAGAAAASGDVLLFLHADTQLPADAAGHLARALADPRALGGNFRIRFTPRGLVADLFAWVYNVRSRARIFYGDSAIFVRREAFEALGGYRLPRLMEDIDLVRRLRRHARRAGGQLVTLPCAVTSSARRFGIAGSALKMLWVWSLLHVLLALGVSQERMERYYRQVR
jgi:rSAM/selenodomain-associated transferase 2